MIAIIAALTADEERNQEELRVVKHEAHLRDVRRRIEGLSGIVRRAVRRLGWDRDDEPKDER